MPTTLVSTTLFLKNRTVSRFRVHFKHGSISKNISLSVRIFGSGFKPYFKLYLTPSFGSGFEPYSKLNLITGWDPDSNRYPPCFHTLVMDPDSNRFPRFLFTVCQDPDSNRYPNYYFSTWGMDPDSNRYPLFSLFTICFGSGFEPFSKQASQLRVFFVFISSPRIF